MRRGAVVGRQEVGDLGAAIAELGAGAAWLDDGHADAERGDLLGYRLGETLDPPLGGVIHGVARKGDLQRLGHASPMVTLTIYAHVIPGNQREAANTFARLIREARAPVAGGRHDRCEVPDFRVLLSCLASGRQEDSPESLILVFARRRDEGTETSHRCSC